MALANSALFWKLLHKNSPQFRKNGWNFAPEVVTRGEISQKSENFFVLDENKNKNFDMRLTGCDGRENSNEFRAQFALVRN